MLAGEDGHLFYVPGETMEALPPYKRLSEEKLQKELANIKLAGNYLAENNIPFLFVTIPDKDEVYPEYYPKYILERPKTSRMAQLADYIRAHSEINAFDLTDDLIAAKNSDFFLYFKNYDPAHWNMNGAFIGYLKIMDHLNVSQKNQSVLSKEDFFIEETPVTKKTASGSYSFDNFSDILYDYKYKKEHSAKLIFSYSGDKVNGLAPETAPLSMEDFEAMNYSGHIYYYKNPESCNGEKLLIIGDSYIHGFLLDVFAQSFSEVYFLSYSKADGIIIKAAAEAFHPDFVVYEIVERMYFDNQFDNFKTNR
jgi:hypothetical protein